MDVILKKNPKKITLKSKLFKKTTLKKEKKKRIEPSQLNQTLESKWNSTSQSHERQRIVLIKRNGGFDMEVKSQFWRDGWLPMISIPKLIFIFSVEELPDNG